jgi:type IX secretion system PorP/SprF family membrane protein
MTGMQQNILKTRLNLRLIISFVRCRKSMLSILTVLLFSAVHSQQIPLFTTYFFNKYLINPAFTGIDNEFRGFGIYRSQWANIPGRPVTGGPTAEASFWHDRIGVGGYVMNDQIGIFHTVNAALSYAQKFQFAKDHQISIGIQGGILTNRIDFASATVADLSDPGLAQQRPLKTVFDMSAGISYKWKTLLVGFSVPNIIQPLASYAASGSEASYQYIRHYTAFGQYKFVLLKGKFNITPQLFMRKAPATGVQFDAMCVLDYNNIVFLGGGYRNAYGVVGMAGVNIFNMFTIAYAYDYTTQSAISGQVGATHEITAGFHLASNYRTKKHYEPKVVIERDSFNVLQKQTDSLAVRVDSTNHLLDSAKQLIDSENTEVKDLRRANAILELKEENYQNVADSLARKVDQLLTLKNLSSEKNLQGNSYRLDKIFFDYNKFDLLPQSREQLNALVDFLKRFPNIQIQVAGYTDAIGATAVNIQLSSERAKAVADYLVQQGIDASRIEARGMGSSNPVADNKTEAGRKLNRRVEFTIVKE